MDLEQLRKVIIKNGLKVTPQRIAVLDALMVIGNHPSADHIISYIKINHPNIAVGTVYKTLETYIEKGIIKKINTDRDIMRYDAVLVKHHHLYCSESNRIEDYFDEELNQLIENYFQTKKLENFKVKDIKLQIIGNFINK